MPVSDLFFRPKRIILIVFENKVPRRISRPKKQKNRRMEKITK
jgi:hypothetical protein